MASSGFNGKKWIYSGAPMETATSVRRALVHASSVISTRDRRFGTRQVCSADMRPLVLHLLDGLERAGFDVVVIRLHSARTRKASSTPCKARACACK